MLTNNWYSFMKHFYAGITDKVVDINGNTINNLYSDLSNYGKALFPTYEPTVVSPAYTDRGVWFGNGTAQPSRDDYRLSGDRVTQYSVVSSNGSSNIQGDEHSLSYIYTLKNTGSEPITISEVCWVGGLNVNSSFKGFMFDRALLETPVVIPAGEQGVILYRRSITVPSA